MLGLVIFASFLLFAGCTASPITSAVETTPTELLQLAVQLAVDFIQQFTMPGQTNKATTNELRIFLTSIHPSNWKNLFDNTVIETLQSCYSSESSVPRVAIKKFAKCLHDKL